MEQPGGLRIILSGRVQGVGFRPFVLRQAVLHGLRGEVVNAGATVEIDAFGAAEALQAFLQALQHAHPPLARPVLELAEPLPSTACPSSEGFRISPSRSGNRAEMQLPPDLSLCDDCLQEWADPHDRRWRHAFINCTQCGPRYTVIQGLPYDRAATSMAGFAMCAACRKEYEDPASRRFHAEPIACPDCGPTLQWERAGRVWPGNDAAALAAAVQALRTGEVLAVKGIGGYHLLCDARNQVAVHTLRQRKHRPHKPLAVMYPLRGADGLDALRADLAPDPAETRALRDMARPIVLVRKRQPCQLADAVAPGLDEVGAFLPYSPLHMLLLADFGGPLVATSGNLSGEPVLTDADEARQRLAPMADAFLHHNRPIVRPADDSVQRVINGTARPLRIGRGMAPLQGRRAQSLAQPLLALGGESKVTVALAWNDRIVMSPHIGDLSSPRGRQVFADVAADLQHLHGVQAQVLITDAHPGYASTRWAMQQELPVMQVLHHHAHASALASEWPDIQRWLVLAWDGVGMGEQQQLWGGEALLGAPGHWQRVGSWRLLRPPGGDRAAREPWRSAAAMGWENGSDLPAWPLPAATLQLAHAAWQKGLQAPATSAAGRLFDAAAACILGLTHCSYEAQAPMQLEALARTVGRAVEPIPLPMQTDAEGVLRMDWAPLLKLCLDQRIAPAQRAAIFHASMAAAAIAQIEALRARHAFDAVGLSGGVFQNRLLAEQVLAALRLCGIQAQLPSLAPANDGGLAWGQAVEAAAQLSGARHD